MARMPLPNKYSASKPRQFKNGVRSPWPSLAPCVISMAFALAGARAEEKTGANPLSLDHLKADLIPTEDRSALHPKELVAVLGNERGRGWGTIGRFTFSPNGKTIACLAGKGVVYLYDASTLVETGAIEIETRPLSSGVFELAFSPDGKKLAVSDWEIIWLYELTGKKPRRVAGLGGHEQGIDNLAFSPDGKTLVSVGSDKTARLWDLSGAPPKEKALLDSGRYSLAISQDGKYLAIGEDGSLILWDITEAEPKELASAKIKAEDWKICGFLPDNKTIISHEGMNLRFWRQKGDKLTCEQTTKLPGGFLALSADSKWLVSTSGIDEGFVQLLKLENLKYQFVARFGPDRGLGWHWPIAISRDGKKLAYTQDVAVIQILETETSKASPLPKAHLGAIDSIAFSPDGKVLATGGSDGAIHLWNLIGDRPKEVNVLQAHSAAVSSLVFSPDGRILASGSEDETVRLWDFKKPKPLLSVLHGPKCQVEGVALSPDGTRIAIGYWQLPDGNGAIWVWDLKEKEPLEIARLLIKQDKADYVMGLIFLHDGKRLISGGVNRSLIWDLENPKKDPQNLEMLYPPYALAPDGMTLAGSNGNYSIKLMDLGQDPPRLKVQLDQGDDISGEVTLAYSPDGETLAVSNRSGKVTIWDTSSYKALFEWKMPGPIGIAFAPDSRHLATANANGTAYILRLRKSQGREK